MAKIVKKSQKIFCASLVAQNNIAKFGSLKIGVPEYSLDPADIQTTEYLNGWAAAVVNNAAPALQDMNALFYLLSYQLAYLMQSGIPEWDSETTYYKGSLANISGVIYRSIADTNLNNAPASSPTYWARFDLAYVGVNPEVGGSSPFQLTIAQKRHQILNPAGAITVKLPTTDVAAGEVWKITNQSTNVITIQSSDGSAIVSLGKGSLEFTALQTTPTGSSHWQNSALLGMVGRTDGVAPSTGMVGEVINGSVISNTVLTTSLQTLSTLNLTPGTWIMLYSATLNYSTGATTGNNGYSRSVVTLIDGTTQVGNTSRITQPPSAISSTVMYVEGCVSAFAIVNISANTTYLFRCNKADTIGTGTGSIGSNSNFFAIRIA